MKTILMGNTYTSGIRKEFENRGYKILDLNQVEAEIDIETAERIIAEAAKKYAIDYLFTLDFFPCIAEACNKLNIRYISWVWDSPHASLWSKTSAYNTNFIFLFDYAQYQTQVGRGLSNVFYLPIGPDIDFFEQTITKDGGRSRKELETDVSFLGNLYTEPRYNLLSQVKYIPPYTKGYIESVMNAQKQLWGVDLLNTCIGDEIWDSLKRYIKWEVGDSYDDGFYEATMTNIFGQKIAQTERKELCSLLSSQFRFDLYTKSDTSFDLRIKNKGYADYKTRMPLIFKYSKININITIRSITSGIPLRVMDVLACGGFLLTNYQPEILQYFEDGKDLVVYSDFEDLCNKAEYYLEHEDERQSIAHSGYAKVKELFSLDKQIDGIINTINMV